MAEPTDVGTPFALRTRRRYAASRERVFSAWITPEAVRRWFIPDVSDWSGPPEIDPRPGGRYRFCVKYLGVIFTIHGTYLEVRPPERLVFTWEWTDDPLLKEDGDSLVTIEFHDREGGTEVVLTHEKLPSEAARKEHAQGWEGCLDQIEALVA